MRRLLRIVTIVLVTMTLLMPVLECFDRWDRPGLSGDSELPLFLVILFIALVILVAVAIARRVMAGQSAQTETDVVYEFVRSELRAWAEIAIPPSVSPPLRI